MFKWHQMEHFFIEGYIITEGAIDRSFHCLAERQSSKTEPQLSLVHYNSIDESVLLR